ncbi:hypothetical protein ACVIGA_005505 [Bradyrhizobium sp. USDA 3240]
MIDVDAQGSATDTIKQNTGAISPADLFKPATRVAGENNGITLAPADSDFTDIDRGNAAAVMTLTAISPMPPSGSRYLNDRYPAIAWLRSAACLVAASHALAPIYLED